MMRPETTDEALWVSSGGNKLSPSAIQTILHRLGRRAGITDVRVSAHTFRHTFGVNMLRAGKDVRYLQAVLGHESLKATEIYVRALSQEDALEWHSNIDPYKGWGL